MKGKGRNFILSCYKLRSLCGEDTVLEFRKRSGWCLRPGPGSLSGGDGSLGWEGMKLLKECRSRVQGPGTRAPEMLPGVGNTGTQ